MRCAVFSCHSDNQCAGFDPSTRFFGFPKDAELLKKWVIACKRSDEINTKYARICSKHFAACDYARNLKHELLNYVPKRYRTLKKDAVPTLLLNSLAKRASKIQMSGRTLKREREKDISMVLERSASGSTLLCGESTLGSNGENSNKGDNITVTNNANKATIDIGVNTDEDYKDKIITSLQGEVDRLTNRVNAVSKLFSEEQFKKLTGSKDQLRWSEDDMSKAFVIYSFGPKTYKLLLKKGYPFPAVSTLHSWLNKNNIQPGIL